jgi:hypothetical protein
MAQPSKNEFENAAKDSHRGIIGEFAQFLTQNKKFWLIPLLLVLLGLGVLLVLGNTAAAPFIYSLF